MPNQVTSFHNKNRPEISGEPYFSLRSKCVLSKTEKKYIAKDNKTNFSVCLRLLRALSSSILKKYHRLLYDLSIGSLGEVFRERLKRLKEILF